MKVISVYVKNDYPWKMLDAAINYGLTFIGEMDRKTLKRLAKNFTKDNSKRVVIRKEKSNGVFPIYFEYLCKLTINERSMLVQDLADTYLALLKGDEKPSLLKSTLSTDSSLLNHANETIFIDDKSPQLLKKSKPITPPVTAYVDVSESTNDHIDENSTLNVTSSDKVTDDSLSSARDFDDHELSDDFFSGIPVP